MHILGITIMRTKHVNGMGRVFGELVAKNIKLKNDNDHLDNHSKILVRKLDSAFAEINCLNAEIARLREIEAEYNRLTDRDEKGRFVRNE